MKRFLLVALVAFSFLLGDQQAQAADRVQALKLYQNHLFFGNAEVIIARQGIHVFNHGRFGFDLVSKAPEWKVTVYRKDDKTYCTEPLTVFEGTGLVSEYHLGFKDRTTDQYKGLSYSDCLIDNVPAKRAQARKYLIEYLPPKSIEPQIEKIAYGMYKVTTNGGFPLRYKSSSKGAKDWLTGHERGEEMQTHLSTQKIESVTVDPTIFDPPKSFKKVDSLLEVLSSKLRRTEATDSFKDLFGW